MTPPPDAIFGADPDAAHPYASPDATPCPVDAIESPALLDAGGYAAHGYPHAAWAALRRADPVHRCGHAAYPPFWAITKHADVTAISRDPRTFASGPRNTLFPTAEIPASLDTSRALRMLLNLDPPEHGRTRTILARQFTPQGLRGIEARVAELARGIVDRVVASARDAGGSGEGDFVDDVAIRLPMAVILELLGVPQEDGDVLALHSHRITGAEDPEYHEGRPMAEVLLRANAALFQYFTGHVAAKREVPGDDLLSRLATSAADGRPLGDFELLSYCHLLLLAGNETTRNATTGGMLALIERPDALARLRNEPSLLDTAVDEIVRWVTPIVYFCRTATADVELRGRTIRKGDTLVLFYPSANRDEEAFADPFRFDVARDPNPHVGFGVGEHFCLGASLARLELRAIFGEILRRIDGIERTGPVERLASSFVGGIKRMPVRYHVKRS